MAHQPSSSARPQARRGASGAWTRLKPMNIDPLDVYGLPSKGETRLHDHKNQEAYYTKIVERYMKFCASSNSSEELESAFASLTLQPHQKHPNIQPTENTQPSTRPSPPPPPTSNTDQPNDLPNILLAMRRLREGILGSRRHDRFAQRAYVFITQASILSRSWESYLPALLHLLRTIHAQTPLSAPELRDHVGYYILDLACRCDDLAAAYKVRLAFEHRDRRVGAVLKALSQGDYVKFWRLKRSVDGYQRALMEFAEERVRLHALKCLGRGYLAADKGFVERVAGARWQDLVAFGVGWQLQEDGKVKIRNPKPK